MRPCRPFVQFSPSDVIIARQEVAGLSVRNHLRGKVCRIIPTPRALFVAVDIGQIVWAEVTAASGRRTGSATGAERRLPGEGPQSGRGPLDGSR